ncbi:MAG: hypothetical protein K0R40_4142, partial [Burkholderiales bacterium]|nr:hypothetical protein [Burkholderiales bacterium]
MACAFNASQAARASRTLANRIGSIERLAQQLTVLKDPTLAADLGRVHAGFRQVADELLQLPLEAAQRNALTKTIEQEQGLYDLLVAKRVTDRARISALTAELAENASDVMAVSSRVADREVLRLRTNAEAVQRQLVLLVIFSTAVALLLALALTRYIARPISEL